MEGRGRSRARRKSKLFSSKRLTSFLLAAAMIGTNVGADLNTAYAAGFSSEVAFEMRGSDLVTAIEDAIATGNTVTPDDLDFTNGKVEQFEGYLFGKGKLYEAYPEVEGGDVSADLRVFVRLPEDGDDMYAVTGDEEVIFLYVNNSNDTVKFRSCINYMVDGEEKVKKTDWVTVRSYESAYGDEEVNVISDPVEPPVTEAPEETEGPANDTETTAPDGETTAPETPETDAPAGETPDGEEGGETDVPETDVPENDPLATDSELTLSMSQNVVSLVAMPGDELATPSDMTDGSEDEEETTAPEETTGSEEETTAAEETTGSEEETTVEEETTTAPAEEETTAAGETETPEAPKATESETEKPEVPNAPKPSYSDLVGVGWSGTAKLYSTTLKKLHALDDVEGWPVNYSIAPAGSARIIDGPRGVEDGEDLYFGVKNQIGYAVETVLANGEELTADTITENSDGSQTVWYNVPEVMEEQDVDVVMTETGEHPAFEDSVIINGVTITATAPKGVIPKGTKLDVTEVTADVKNVVAEKVVAENGGNVNTVLAYDINLVLGDAYLDNSWSEQGYVTVIFSGEKVKQKTAQGNTVEIYAVDDSTVETLNANNAFIASAETLTLETVATEVNTQAGMREVAFDASHFTIYAVVSIYDKATRTYEFYNGEELVDTQIIKDGETLKEPEIPSSENGNQFLGWSAEGEENDYQSFGTPIAVTETETVRLYARFAQTYYIRFHYNSVVQQVKSAKTGDTVDVTDVEIETSLNQALVGWSLVENGQVPVGNSITVENQDIDLYPIIETVLWITYHSNGGTYIEPSKVVPGEKPTIPSAPVKVGYTFDGWYIDPDLTEKFNFNNALNASQDVYAKWTGKQVNYRVIYWQENADDDDYSYKESELRRGTAGELTNGYEGQFKDYEGFERRPLSGQQRINGDGSTIVNVYYDRKEYDVKFYKYTYTGGFPGSYKEIQELRITAKYGADISNQWPSERFPDQYGPNWNVSENSSVMQAAINIMPLGGAKFYYTNSDGDNTYYINHYLEALPGEQSNTFKGYNNRYYYESPRQEIIKSDSLESTPEDAYDIPGFEYSENVNFGWDNKADFTYVSGWKYKKYKIDFYYYRNSHSVEFINGGVIDKTVSKKYGESMEELNYTPSTHSGVDESYEFAGWYDNEFGEGTPYDFENQTMPDANVVLYAIWKAPSFTVEFDTNGGIGTYPDQVVIKGEKATEPDTEPTRAEYTFAGWTEDGRLFNFESEIHHDVKLKAKWLSTHQLKVKYDLNGGIGEVPIDPYAYADGAHAMVLELNGTVSHPEKKVFIGWKIGNEIFYPGEIFMIDSTLAVNDIITLTAQWGDVTQDTSLIYHANNGTDARYEVPSIMNNATVTVKAVDDPGLNFIYTDHKFIGWNTKADGTGDTYVPGDKIVVDINGENHLYAMWKEQIKVTVTVTGNTRTVPYTGEKQTVTGFTVDAPDDVTVKLADGAAATAEGTDAQVYYMGLTADDFVATSTNDEYSDIEVKVVDGWLKITPVKETLTVTVTGNTDSVVYTGEEQSVTGFTSDAPETVTVTLKEGKKAEAKGTVAGTYAMGLSADDFEATSTNYEKIEVKVIDGWLKIIPIGTDIIITASSSERIYDGKPLTNDNYTYTEGVLVEGDELIVKITGAQTNVGQSENVVTDYSVMRGTRDVTDCYIFGKSVKGTLEVTPRNVVLISASDTKKYDGQPLTNNKIEITGDGFVQNEGATYDVTGSQTEVGDSDNIFTYELNANTKPENYVIETKYGILSVTIRDNLHYVVNYFYMDENGKEVHHEQTEGHDGVYLEPIPYNKDSVKEWNDQKYVLARIEGEGKQILLDESQNVVNVYYGLDRVGGTDPDDPNKPTPDDKPDMYQLIFTYKSADPNTGKVIGEINEVHTFTNEDGSYTPIEPTYPAANVTTAPAANYAFDYWVVEGKEDDPDYTRDMTFLKQTAYDTDTTFVAYFDTDEIGKEDPEKPDGVPDKYQIKFTYETEDSTHGTIDGASAAVEVVDRPRNSDGSYDMEKGVSPSVNVTVDALGRYRFENWTDEAGNTYSTSQLQAATFTADATFTAHFRYVSGNGNGSGGGSSSGSGGNPYNPDAPGPGTVMIDDDNVPLAPLPQQEGESFVIDEDSVPLAPLPKTGQQSSRIPVTMLLTGIFLALASLTRRREEES